MENYYKIKHFCDKVVQSNLDTSWTHLRRERPLSTHYLFDEKVQLYKRGNGRYWQCAARVAGKRYRESTREEHLDRAKDVAEEWYLDLRGKLRRGEMVHTASAPATALAPPKPVEKTFREATEAYLREIRVLAATVRSPKYVEYLELRMNRHILPYFGDKPLSAINRGMIQSYRVQRAEETIVKTGKPPARSTMTQEIVHIRQVLKHAEGNGWMAYVPNLSTPYMTQGKRGRRAWFSPEDYEKLYKATRRRITEGKRPGWKAAYEDTHDFVLFMGNSGLRPDEAVENLQIRDVAVIIDPSTNEEILSIDVRGKTGVGYCMTMPGAVHPFRRARNRREAELKAKGLSAEEVAAALPTTSLFPKFHRALFNGILAEEGLKFDRDGQRRTAYSLRHTYISMRLMDGADIHQIANNCRTSVEMIEQFYASHIRDRLDPSVINRRRSKVAKKASKKLRTRHDEGGPPLQKPRRPQGGDDLLG